MASIIFVCCLLILFLQNVILLYFLHLFVHCWSCFNFPCEFHVIFFCSKFCVRKDFLTSPSILKKRLVFLGIAMFFLSPCLVIFPLVYMFLRHAEEFYNHPSTASSRRWSNLSRWILREYNEVEMSFICRGIFLLKIFWMTMPPFPFSKCYVKFASFYGLMIVSC